MTCICSHEPPTNAEETEAEKLTGESSCKLLHPEYEVVPPKVLVGGGGTGEMAQ